MLAIIKSFFIIGIMSQSLEHRSRLPDSYIGDDRCVEVHPFGNDMLLHVWSGEIDRDLARDHLDVARFHIMQNDASVLVAAMFGYFSRLHAEPEQWEQLIERTNQLPKSTSVYIPRGNRLGRIARGEYSAPELDIDRRGQRALAPRLAGAIGIYLAEGRDGTKNFTVLAHDEHRLEHRVLQRARFAPEDIPQLAGMVCKLASAESRTEIARINQFTYPWQR